VDAAQGEMRARGRTFRTGAVITIDGSRGEVLAGVFAEVSARLPDIRVDHQLGDEIRIAERLLDGLAAP